MPKHYIWREVYLNRKKSRKNKSGKREEITEENTQKGRNENCGVLEKENLLKSQGDSVSRITYDTGSLIPRDALPSPPQHWLEPVVTSTLSGFELQLCDLEQNTSVNLHFFI